MQAASETSEFHTEVAEPRTSRSVIAAATSQVAYKRQYQHDRSLPIPDRERRRPVTDWLQSVRDKQAQAKVRIRLKRLEAGIFGDCDSVGEGVMELREHLGAGYRVYFGRHGQSVVILLCGGSKKTQSSDIRKAREYWADWKRRQA